jgi:anti-anti-sigma factor
MMFEHDDYAIECADGSDRIVLRGVMRLPTPAAFEQAFAPIAARIDAGEPLRVDLCGVPFMNSSGIRALATLVLRARDRGARLRLVGSANVPWQKKTLASLQAISRELEVET